ncbi:alpha/beta hydrolase [Herbaspirillum lusitanum]|nr:alpha/beta hydrolase [Herbaspirillum lusitanum]
MLILSIPRAVSKPKNKGDHIMSRDKISSVTDHRLVFIHGFLDNASLWKPLMSILTTAGYKCTAPDLPGAGARRSDLGPYTLDRATKDIVDHVGEDGTPVILIGHSMGAQIAELVTARLKNKVSALILLTPTPLEGNNLPDAVRSMLRESGGDAPAQEGIRQAFSKNLSADDLRNSTTTNVLMGKEAARGYYDAFTGGDSAGFSTTTCESPILIIGAEEDPVIAPEMVRKIHTQRFPSAQLRFIPNSGHWPHLEQPRTTARLITVFLQTVS